MEATQYIINFLLSAEAKNIFKTREYNNGPIESRGNKYVYSFCIDTPVISLRTDWEGPESITHEQIHECRSRVISAMILFAFEGQEETEEKYGKLMPVTKSGKTSLELMNGAKDNSATDAKSNEE